MSWLTCVLLLVSFIGTSEAMNRLHLRRLRTLRASADAALLASNERLSMSLERNAASVDRFTSAVQNRDSQAWLAEVTRVKEWLRVNGSN